MDVVDKKSNDPLAEGEESVSIFDYKTFATKHIPGLGHDAKEFQVFHWKLHRWSLLDRKLTSPAFDCGGHTWRILLFPSGASDTLSHTVSVYLNHASHKETEEDWHACAQFVLAISNPHDPTVYTASYARHRFITEEPDWGFTRFSELPKLLHPRPGHNRPMIEEDSTVFSAYVRVLEDPTGVLWHNFINYDSKRETGYVGIKNQGATGYMNSVLQSLFCTNYFRKAVYQIPTEDQNPTESIPLALQRVFYNLQTSNQAVATTELTKSFGWTSLDLFIQQDVYTFNRVLQEKLEFLMKGTPVEGVITKLFVGKMNSVTKCIDVDYESSRIEKFNDIELKVKGMKTLYTSFRDYLAVKTLDGEFKYEAGQFGLQGAQKGATFLSLPPVLHLRVKRYEYDTQQDTMVKISDRFEFPSEIDLDEFLDEKADRSRPWRYKLYGVLAHSGDMHGGHYFALIKPDQSPRWLKFDDDRVTPVTDREVLEENYGGEPLNSFSSQTWRNQANGMKRSTNARMLIYIHEAGIDEILAPLTTEDIPPRLRRRLDEEHTQVEVENGREEQRGEEQDSFLTVKVITDETFSRHQGFDLAIFNEGDRPLSNLPTFHVIKQERYSVFKLRVARHFGYPGNQIRLWLLVNRQNKTVRLDMHIPENEPSLTVDVIRVNMATRRQRDIWLYLDILPDPPMRALLGDPGTIMVFLKHFDTTRQSLLGIGKVYISRTSKVNDLIPLINEKMGWLSWRPLRLYEEIKPGEIKLMDPNHTLSQCIIQDGDIVCFQVYISDQEVHNPESPGLYSNPIQFYTFLQNRVTGPNVIEESSPGVGSLGAIPDIGTQQQQHGNILPQFTSLVQLLQNPDQEIMGRVSEMDERLGDRALPDQERRKLFNELCKICSRYRVIPKSMHIPDCSKDSVEVESGGYANVLQSTYKGHRVAVKVVRMYLTSNLDVILSRFCREGVAWKHLRHPNILPLLGVTLGEHQFAMVSEWMENGNINQFVEKDQHANRTMLLVDVANGLKYLHDLRIVHGDMKGANILINKDRRACIADFGMTTITGVVPHTSARASQSSLISNDSLMSFTAGGTYRWMSPELMYPERFGMPQSEDNRPTTQSDCYALGMVIYEVLCGHHPYVEIQSDILVVNAVMEGVRPKEPEGVTHHGLTKGLWGAVERCWLEDRSARPSVEDILSCLNDAAVRWYTREF